MNNYQIKLLPTPNLPRDKVVYLHLRATDKVPMYVGIGDEDRPYVTKQRNKDWTTMFKSHGRTVELLFTNLIEWHAKSIEVALIAKYRQIYGKYREGGTMTNLSNGGEGCGGYKFTEEQLANLSASMTGKKKTEEHRANISASKTGDKHPLYGRGHTEEHRAKISASGKIAQNRPEVKAKLCGTNNPNYGKIGEQSHLFQGFAVGVNDNSFVIIAGGQEMKNCGFNRGHISQCILGNRASHKGFSWKRQTTINPDDFIGLEPYNELSAERLNNSKQ